MSAPNKLTQKAFYWGPLFVGVVSLVAGAVLVRGSADFEFGNRYAAYQAKRDGAQQQKLADVSSLKQGVFKQSALVENKETGAKTSDTVSSADKSSDEKTSGEMTSGEKTRDAASPVLEEKQIVKVLPPKIDEQKKSDAPEISKQLSLNGAKTDEETSNAHELPSHKLKPLEEVKIATTEDLEQEPEVADEKTASQTVILPIKKSGVRAENLPVKKPENFEHEALAALKETKEEKTAPPEQAQKLAATTDGALTTTSIQEKEEVFQRNKSEHSKTERSQTERSLTLLSRERTVLPSVIVAENSQLAGLEGGEAFSGLNKIDQGFEKLKVSQLSETVAQMGLISQNVADKLVRRSVIFTARREATAFGMGGQAGLDGLQLAGLSHSRPLILHLAQNLGTAGNKTFSGLKQTDETIKKLARQELIASTVEVGSGPLFAKTGIATSLELAARMQQHYSFAVAGREIAIVARKQSYNGFGMALRDVSNHLGKLDGERAGDDLNDKSTDKISRKAGVDLAVLGHLNKDTLDPANREGALSKTPPRCSENFYNTLKALNELKIASLSKVVKPISRIDKSLPGRWYFKPSIAGVKRVCSRYKRYYSGRKKCIRWKKQVTPLVVTDGPDQKAFFKLASGLIAGKGRHPIVKSKSPGHWLINRVARDLKSYSLQKPHPAICTGALGMVSYFEGNLKKVKIHIDEVARLSAESDEFLNYWQGELQKTMKENSQDVGTPTARRGKELSIEEQLDRIASQRHLTVFKEDFDISSIDLPLALGQVAIRIYGAEAAVEIKASDDILFALSESRKLLRAHRKRLSKRLYAVLYKFYSTVEASYYIRRSHERYKPLNDQLFGSLQDIRSAHQTHCVCQN